MLVPAGYVQQAYDAVYTLNSDKTKYIGKASPVAIQVPEPGLPFSLVFRTEPGKEDVLLEIASAYEKASRRRVSPPNFQ
jgi:Asp-tRNA(Asn)/Glu-tRNA(Gln) amidotransferase A subunit family amidase